MFPVKVEDNGHSVTAAVIVPHVEELCAPFLVVASTANILNPGGKIHLRAAQGVTGTWDISVHHVGLGWDDSMLNAALDKVVLWQQTPSIYVASDDWEGEAILSAVSGRYALHQHKRPAKQSIFLGNALTFAVRATSGCRRDLQSALQILALVCPTVTVDVFISDACVPHPESPIAQSSKKVRLGSRGTRAVLHLALWQRDDDMSIFPGCADLFIFNGSSRITCIAEPSLIEALMCGIARGRSNLQLRLEESRDGGMRGEWIQWGQRGEFHLKIVVQLSSKHDQADGTNFKEGWRERLEKGAYAASNRLAAQMDARRVAQNQSARDKKIRQQIAEQIAQVINAWLTETGQGAFQGRCIDTMMAIEDDDDQEHETVLSWVRNRIIRSLPEEEEDSDGKE